MLLVLCSIEHSPLSGLFWAILARFLPIALAPPMHHWCPGSLWLSFPLQVCSGSELCSSLGSISPDVLACAKQPVLGRAPGLLPHQELPLLSSPCMQYKCRAGTSAFHASLAKKHSGALVGAQKVGLASRSVILRKIARTSSSSSSSSSSFGCDRSRSSFFKFSLFRKQGLLGLYSCCPIL